MPHNDSTIGMGWSVSEFINIRTMMNDNHSLTMVPSHQNIIKIKSLSGLSMATRQHVIGRSPMLARHAKDSIQAARSNVLGIPSFDASFFYR